MLTFVLKRLAALALSLIIVSIVIFLLMHSIPGGPFDEGDMPLAPATRELLARQYGLDQPLHIQYLKYMGNALQFNFGYSYQSPGETVAELLGRTWRVSALLGGLGLLIAFPVGIGLGILSAVRRNSWLDYLTTLLSTFGITVPVYVISMMLILLFAVWLRLLPTGGWGGYREIIMPAIAYSFFPLGTIARYTRSSVLEVLNRPFVTTLKAKGVSPTRIVLKHVMRNAAIPLLTISLPMLTGIMTGSIFVEQIFRAPGLGRYFVSSILTRDYPLMMTLILLVTVLLGATYMITDILYAWVDPRIRIGGDRSHG